MINIRSFNFKIFCLIILYSCVSIALRHKAKVSSPFIKTKWQNILNLKFVCNMPFFTIKECAEQCYHTEKIKEGCTGFILNTGSNGCFICKSASLSEISSASYTQMTDGQVVYLKRRKYKPDIYFPLEPENITGTVLAGDGIFGSISLESRTSSQMGKVSQGLHVQSGAQIRFTGTGNECFLNMPDCPDNSLTLMMWIKQTARGDPHLTFSVSNSINLKLGRDQTMCMWVLWNSFPFKILDGIASQSTIELNTWTHVAAVYNHNIGGFVYLNGILEVFKPISEAIMGNGVVTTGTYLLIGGKGGNNHNFNGILDEVKIFYRQLTSSGKHIYRPQGKVMLLQASVCSKGGRNIGSRVSRVRAGRIPRG